jgi:hypothetical protein
MSEAPQSPASVHAQANAPRPAALDNNPGPVVPYPLLGLQIPHAANVLHPLVIEMLKVPDLSIVSSAIQPLDREKRNWTTWSRAMTRIFQLLDAQEYISSTLPLPNPAIHPNAAHNWHYNNTYLIMLISNHIVESEHIHTNNCNTAHQTWNNLRKYHQLSTYQIFIDKCRVLESIKANNGNNISDHLIKLKKQWKTIKLFDKELYQQMVNNTLFKKQIVTSMPCSWDSFNANYVKCFLDDDAMDIDEKKRVNSQELIGIICQEYSRRCEDEHRPPKEEKTRSSNSDRPSTQNNNQMTNQDKGKST